MIGEHLLKAAVSLVDRYRSEPARGVRKARSMTTTAILNRRFASARRSQHDIGAVLKVHYDLVVSQPAPADFLRLLKAADRRTLKG